MPERDVSDRARCLNLVNISVVDENGGMGVPIASRLGCSLMVRCVRWARDSASAADSSALPLTSSAEPRRPGHLSFESFESSVCSEIYLDIAF